MSSGHEKLTSPERLPKLAIAFVLIPVLSPLVFPTARSREFSSLLNALIAFSPSVSTGVVFPPFSAGFLQINCLMQFYETPVCLALLSSALPVLARSHRAGAFSGPSLLYLHLLLCGTCLCCLCILWPVSVTTSSSAPFHLSLSSVRSPMVLLRVFVVNALSAAFHFADIDVSAFKNWSFQWFCVCFKFYFFKSNANFNVIFLWFFRSLLLFIGGENPRNRKRG